MICYADTSFLVAWFHPSDSFAVPVTEWTVNHVTDFVWNPILRMEVRHTLRKLKSSYAQTAWQAYRASEKTRRLVLGRRSVSELFDDGDQLSGTYAKAFKAGTWDFVHVGAFLESKAHFFATLDRVQADLASECVDHSRVKLFD